MWGFGRAPDRTAPAARGEWALKAAMIPDQWLHDGRGVGWEEDQGDVREAEVHQTP
jgi:hypothetical protein